MTTTTPPQVSFSSGEVSALLARRFDYQRAQTGLAACLGFSPLREGGFTRLPGTEYDGTTRGNAAARLISFQFAVDDALVLEFTALKLRVWRYGVLIEDPGSPGTPYEIDTPFDAASIAALQWEQSADVIYLADGTRPVQRLARYALDNWTIADAYYKSGPFRVQNLDKDLTLQASATTGAITLTASANFFEANHVGSLIRLMPTDLTSVALWTTNTPVSVGTLMRNGGKTYKLTVGSDTKESPPTHDEGTQRVSYDPDIQWEFVDDGAGIVEITAVASGTSATATVLKAVPKTCVDDPTYRFSEGAWSARYGYPAALAIDDQRFVAAATPSDPRTVWFSLIGDYGDFEPSTAADGSFAYTVAGQNSLNQVNNLTAGRSGLHIFALGEEYSARATTNDTAVSATNTKFGFDSRIGSSNARPIAPDGAPIFISRDKSRVFQITYSFENDANRADELSLPASHLGAELFEEIAWQSNPQRIAWFRRGNGELALMLHDPAQDVLGWARHSLAGGFVESMTVSPDATGTFDVLTMVVRREIDGETRRHVERLSVTYGVLTGSQPITDANHTFAARFFAEDPGTDTFDMSHLIGETVYAWTDQGQFGPYTVPPDGQLVIETPVASAVIGLFDTTHFVETLDIQATANDGNTIGRQKRLQGQTGVAIYRTAAGWIAPVERDLGQDPREGMRQRLVENSVGAALTKFWSGVTRIGVPTGFASEISLRFYPDGAAPMTITGVIPAIEEAGR